MASTTMSLASLLASGMQDRNPMALEVLRRITFDQFTSQMPTKGINGVHNIYRRRGTTPLVKVHDVGGAVCEGTATSTVITDQVGRILAQPSIDRKVYTGANLIDAWIDQIQAFVPQIREKAADRIINGTGATDGDVIGLKKLASNFGSNQLFRSSTTTSGVAIKFHHLDRISNLVLGSNKFFLMHPNTALDLKVLGLALGGNTWGQTMIPYAVADGNGVIGLMNKPVASYNGIPIFESNWMTTETTNGGSGKYRVLCGSFDDSDGVSMFYPQSDIDGPTTLGMQILPAQQKESQDEKFVRIVWQFGISAKSTQSLAQGVNFKFTNSAT